MSWLFILLVAWVPFNFVTFADPLVKASAPKSITYNCQDILQGLGGILFSNRIVAKVNARGDALIGRWNGGCLAKDGPELPVDSTVYVRLASKTPQLEFLPDLENFFDPQSEMAFVNVRRRPNSGPYAALITRKLGLYYLNAGQFRSFFNEGAEAIIHTHGFSSVGRWMGIQYSRDAKMAHSYTKAGSHRITRIRDGFYILHFAETEPLKKASTDRFYQIQFSTNNPSWALSDFSDNLNSIAFVNSKGTGANWQTRIFKVPEKYFEQNNSLIERNLNTVPVLEEKKGIATGAPALMSASGRYLITRYGSDEAFQLWNIHGEVAKVRLPYLGQLSKKIIFPLLDRDEEPRAVLLTQAAISANDRWLAVAIRAAFFNRNSRRTSNRYITLLFDLEAPEREPHYFVSPVNQTSEPALNLNNDGLLRIVTSSLQGITIADIDGDRFNAQQFIAYPNGSRPNNMQSISSVRMSALGDQISVTNFKETYLFNLSQTSVDPQKQTRSPLDTHELSAYMQK